MLNTYSRLRLVMALSLVCQDCKAQLRGVQEMQSHTESTGHTSFEESTEPASLTKHQSPNLHSIHSNLIPCYCFQPDQGRQSRKDFAFQVLNLQCKSCGKPCRSKTEKDLHTKRTGHDTFEDKVRPCLMQIPHWHCQRSTLL